MKTVQRLRITMRCNVIHCSGQTVVSGLWMLFIFNLFLYHQVHTITLDTLLFNWAFCQGLLCNWSWSCHISPWSAFTILQTVHLEKNNGLIFPTTTEAVRGIICLEMGKTVSSGSLSLSLFWRIKFVSKCYTVKTLSILASEITQLAWTKSISVWIKSAGLASVWTDLQDELSDCSLCCMTICK